MKRYAIAEFEGLVEDEYGDWCRYAEVALLKAALRWCLENAAWCYEGKIIAGFDERLEPPAIQVPPEFVPVIAEAKK